MMARGGADVGEISPDDVRQRIREMGDYFKHNAPLGPAEAATIVLAGLRAGKWRILVGQDAEALDAFVRADPESAYEVSRLAEFRPLGD